MNNDIKKSFISFRIAPSQWLRDERFSELLSLFEKHKGVTDEITFFSADTHAPITLELMSERCGILYERMLKAREFGYKAGINILATIGHHDENLSESFNGDFVRMTDIDGNLCLGSFCPNDEGFRDNYIKRIYESLVSAEPDYIWIDDDVRLFGHMPIVCGCFCDNCLEIFIKEYGLKYTRKSLKETLNTGKTGDKLNIRTQWLQHNRNTMAKLFVLIENVVHNLKPDMPLGFMTGDRFYEGYDFENWANILSGPDKATVIWRPGGGFYTEDSLKEMVCKSHDIGRQISVLPDEIISIQSEIENFPYQRFKKSSHVTILEAASHIAAGCTGAAFNVLSIYDEPLDEYDKLVSEIKDKRAFFDLMVKHLGRSKPKGIYSGWNKDSFASYNISQHQWFEGRIWEMAAGHSDELLEIGIPASYSLEQASVSALSGDMVLSLSDEEIRQILSSGVYTDAKALDNLNKMGYQEFTGFSFERSIEADAIEFLLEHQLNGKFVNRMRDGRMSFWWPGIADSILPCSENAEILAKMVDYADNELATCSMGIFENKLGGRVCVAGYFPWTQLQNLSKASQIKNIMRWLSKDKLPAYIDSYHKVNIWVRGEESRGYVIPVINSYSDPAEGLTLALRTEKEQITVVDMNCDETIVSCSDIEDPYRKFKLPTLNPWQMYLVSSGDVDSAKNLL